MIEFEIKNLPDSTMVWPAGKSGYIGYCDNIFDQNFCNSLIDLCLDMPDRSSYGKTLGGVQRHIKNSIDWALDANYDIPQNKEQEFDKRIYDETQKVANLYRLSFQHLLFHCDEDSFCKRDSGYQVQKYEQNIGSYTEHLDGALWIDSGPRTLGLILYLNTVETGGGTQFPIQDITINAVAGRVAVFPAYWTHPHSGLMPLSSDKWIVSTFMY